VLGFFVFFWMDRCEEDGAYGEAVFVGRIDGQGKDYDSDRSYYESIV
jgi:hypothetical protein